MKNIITVAIFVLMVFMLVDKLKEIPELKDYNWDDVANIIEVNKNKKNLMRGETQWGE